MRPLIFDSLFSIFLFFSHATIVNMKKLEQGITDFKKFIDHDCYFVDKTHLIGHLIDHPSEVHLITRPRRFGKTLNLSMIRYFFEAPIPPPGDGLPAEFPAPNAPLFDGLFITGHPECRKYRGQYPVIALSFKNVKGTSRDESMEIMKAALADEFKRHAHLTRNHFLDNEEKAFFQRIQSRKGSDGDYAESIKNLSTWLHRSYGKKAYILLDEYDTPLQSAYAKGYYDQMIDFIRSFMVQTFKDNPDLQQAVVIGILKVAQESIFSDFNNPAVSTVLNSNMKDCFGFTESEVETMTKHFGLESKMDGIKEWYNGYIFGGDTIIYNPWSLVSFIRNASDGLLSYWSNTSDNQLVKDVLQLDREGNRNVVEQFLRAEEVRKEVSVNIAFPQIKDGPEDLVWGFLLHGGYLKASKMLQHSFGTDYCIEIPNREVFTIYNNVIKGWLNTDLNINRHFMAFIQGIRDMNAATIERNLGDILFSLASYNDTATARQEETRRENFYHGLVLGLLAYLGGEYRVESNRECGMGRPDIVLIRLTDEPGQSKDALLFEFKQGNTKKKTPLVRLAKTAYREAVKKHLSGVREKWHPDKVLVLGIGFRGKNLSVYSSAR